MATVLELGRARPSRFRPSRQANTAPQLSHLLSRIRLDRMQRTGMSWKQPGAQAMLALRRVALNGDWDDFQDFYRRREGEALYPNRQLLEEVSWPLAV